MSRLDKYENFPLYRIADDDETRGLEAEKIDHEGTQAFLVAHPEYFACEENSKLLEAWMYLHGELPFTRLNLELAQRALGDSLKVRPLEPEVVDKNRGILVQVGDVLAHYVCQPEEAAQLAKVADDPNISDYARKARDRRLALLAGQQRRELAPQNLYR